MYGYVRPDKGELKVSEYELYRAAYCGLCHALKKRCGFGARMALSYDLRAGRENGRVPKALPGFTLSKKNLHLPERRIVYRRGSDRDSCLRKGARRHS